MGPGFFAPPAGRDVHAAPRACARMPDRRRAGRTRHARHRDSISASRTVASMTSAARRECGCCLRPGPRPLAGAARPDRLPYAPRQGPHLAAHAEPDRRRTGRRVATTRTGARSSGTPRTYAPAWSSASPPPTPRARSRSARILIHSAPQASISFPVFKAVRDAWAGRIAMQVSSIAPPDIFLTDGGQGARRHRGGCERQPWLRLAHGGRLRTIRCRRNSTAAITRLFELAGRARYRRRPSCR